MKARATAAPSRTGRCHSRAARRQAGRARSAATPNMKTSKHHGGYGQRRQNGGRAPVRARAERAEELGAEEGGRDRVGGSRAEPGGADEKHVRPRRGQDQQVGQEEVGEAPPVVVGGGRHRAYRQSVPTTVRATVSFSGSPKTGPTGTTSSESR